MNSTMAADTSTQTKLAGSIRRSPLRSVTLTSPGWQPDVSRVFRHRQGRVNSQSPIRPRAIVLSADRALSEPPAWPMRRRLGARHDAVVITQSALRPTGAPSHAARRPSVVPTVLRLLAAPIVGGAVGVVLGYWCQRVAGTGGVAGTLAELGAPWILAAFVAGALPMIAADRRPRAQLGAGVVGALAGATSLVVATVVYYGPARTGRLDVPDARGITAMWAVVGIAVGVVIGAAGALWRSAPSAAQAVGCLVVAGTAV